MTITDTRGPRTPQAGRGPLTELLALILPLVLGVLVAVLWRLLTPATSHLGDEGEAAAAVDGTLAGLGLLTGLLVGLSVLLWPGAVPARRTLVVIVACIGGAVISWLVGNQFGTPKLRATGAAFIWPATTAFVIMVGAIAPWTSHRLEPRARTEDDESRAF